MIKNCIQRVLKTQDRGLIQHRLNKETLKLVCFTDSIFANIEYGTTLLGYCVLVTGDTGRINWIQYASYRSLTVVRSVVGEETYAFADGCDVAFMILHALEKILRKSIPLTKLTGSMSLFKGIISTVNTT